MTEIARRKYEHSPIIEVLCDIQFEKVPNDLNKWQKFHKRIFDKYPNAGTGKKITLLERKNEGEEGSTPELIEVEARRFANDEKTKIIQVSEGTIVYNDIETPYKGYESFKDDFMKIIGSYIEINNPQKVERLEVRYINEIRFSLESSFEFTEIHKYFNFAPRVDGNILSFQFQFQVKSFHDGHFLFVTLMTLPLETDSTETAYLIDIQNIFLTTNVVDINDIEATLRDAHENIGRVFENIITPETRAIFKEVENNDCKW